MIFPLGFCLVANAAFNCSCETNVAVARVQGSFRPLGRFFCVSVDSFIASNSLMSRDPPELGSDAVGCELLDLVHGRRFLFLGDQSKALFVCNLQQLFSFIVGLSSWPSLD